MRGRRLWDSAAASEIGDLSRGARDLVRALASYESDELTGSGKK